MKIRVKRSRRTKRGKKGSRKKQETKMVPINGHHDYVLSMVQKIETLIADNPDSTFGELDDMVLNDDELKEFSNTQTSIYLILTKTNDPDRFKKIYSLIDLKKKVHSGECDPAEAYSILDNMDFDFKDI